MSSTERGLRDETILGIFVGMLFSFLSIGHAVMLTGGETIYWHPPWSQGPAMAYGAGGLLLQAAFCGFRGNNGTVLGIGAQALAGLVYLALTLTTGELYQS